MEAEVGGKKTVEFMGNLDGRKTAVTDLDLDTLVICAAKLQLRDLANMAGVCHQFREAAYADSVWEDQCRIRWPPQSASWGGTFQFCGGRDAFVGRHYASQQFRYHDPVDWTSHLPPSPITHILLDNDSIAVSQGSNISIVSIGCPSQQPEVVRMLRDHNARITCMRLLPREMVPHSCRNGVMGPDNNVLVTSSSDHTIRLWGSGRPRTFRGHNVAVNTLADRLLGRSGSGAVLASGGEDGRVRLWSLNSVGGNRGKSPLVATFHAHSESVKDLIIAGHNDSLLVSTSRSLNPKIRVWDVHANTTASGCVGTMHGPEGIPVKLLCDGSTCFVAGGSKVIAFDLRFMSNVATVAVHEPGIASFARSSTGTVFGTGGYDKTAKLWDMRMCGDAQPEPWVSLGDHVGPVHCLHVDRYKVVSGGQMDRLVRVWDANTASEISVLDTIELDMDILRCGVSAMAVQGPRLLTGTCGDVSGVLRYRDFSNCTNPLDTDEGMSEPRRPSSSKFWESEFDRSSKG
ncbi:hypothetical protein R1flu_000599 [Riccia fluitans]|uniref:Uncharacterized protein n=1 Tax=Riccia fluitans TaxID=41844 RepID=A0ABD1Y1T8_9MARC